MKAIKSRDTKPELIVRRLLHRHGFRYRVCAAKLPGKPDLWLAKWNVAIFVNGCFWHGHSCSVFRLPRTRTDFWREKIALNKARDDRNIHLLRERKIRVLIIWECALKGKSKLSEELLFTLFKTWLKSGSSESEITSDGLFIRTLPVFIPGDNMPGLKPDK